MKTILLALLLLPFFKYSQPNAIFKTVKTKLLRVDSILDYQGRVLELHDCQKYTVQDDTSPILLSLYFYTSWATMILGLIFLFGSFLKAEEGAVPSNKTLRSKGTTLVVVAVVLLLAWYFPVT